MSRPRVLVVAPYFLPSRQGGRSVRALEYLTHHLGAHYEFVLAAGRRDLNGREDFTDSSCEAARRESGLDIRHLSHGLALPGQLRSLLDERWDLIYLNSLLSPRFTALPLLLEQGHGRPLLLAPRGEWMPGALALKRRRKQAWLLALRALGALRSMHWHATSEEEAAVLRELDIGPVWLAPDLPPPPPLIPATAAAPVPVGPLSIVYLSRIDRKKNLGFLIDALHEVRLPMQLSIYGPVADAAYWRECQCKLRGLPAHVQARYCGELAPAEVLEVLSQHELFVLPTRGENHGYVVGEALLAGCNVLVSDQTPWNAYRQDQILQTFPLQATQFLARAIDALASRTPAERRSRREAAMTLGRRALDATPAVQATRAMFDAVRP